MEKLYNHHLKKKTISSVNWYDLFLTWLDQKSEVIELYTKLSEIYSPGHKFSKHEIETWHSMLRSTSCKNITPFPRKESYVTPDREIKKKEIQELKSYEMWPKNN
ncbi:12859_t:CDS:2 [Entrophospora sp. SA101]|nr:12859_t:CDS:2 [Entrophospora sp. SA101]